jgi:sugar fermentation stimulation protein A
VALWDVAFDSLVSATFLRRLSRFHALVETGAGTALAHVPSTGRLREVLVPGNAVLLAPRPGRRRTSYDLLLARIPEGEGGPGWACLDSRLPPLVVLRALQRDAIPGLEGYGLVAREPRLGRHRADLLLAGGGGEALLEVKSITLVRGGAGLFPDCPTLRGREQTLALASAQGRRRLLLFLVQRADARAVRVNEPADPAFAAAVRRAEGRGVEVLAGRCQVERKGMRWLAPLPLERFRPGLAAPPLPDYLRPGLRLLVVGTSPGLYSAWYGMYFARPGNRFWPAARAAGLVPPSAGPGDEPYLCREQGLGFTDVVKRPHARVADIGRWEWAQGAARLRSLVRRYRPSAVCFVGLAGARAVLGAGAACGPWTAGLEGVPAFVLPATSGRQATYGTGEIRRSFRALAAWLAALEQAPSPAQVS